MKKKVFICLVSVFMVAGFNFVQQAKADKEPVKYCWFNEVIRDCDTGGMWVCYGVTPPNCR